MSTAPLGAIGSITTGQLQRSRGADSERAAHDVGAQSRATEASRTAENAAGVGEMDQEGETSERDADGRRLWERPDPKKTGVRPGDDDSNPPKSKDPSGQAGLQIDLSG